MVEVTVRNGEQLERALRRFKKKWERAGVLREVKRKSFLQRLVKHTKVSIYPHSIPLY